MKKVIQVVLTLAVLCAPVAAEPVPPGPVCPDPCTEYHCTPQGICYCRPYPWPERCGPLVAGFSQSSVLASFADEPAPNANACIVQCKSDCVNDAAAQHIDCLLNHPIGYEEICTQLVADFLSVCKALCESETCGTPV